MRTPARTFLALLACLPASLSHGSLEIIAETMVFHIPGRGPRVDVNMAVLAGTAAVAANERGFQQARVEVTTIIERDGVIKDFAKAQLLGPERLDTLASDLVHQEFFDLEPGEYDLTIEARDLNAPEAAVVRRKVPLAVGTQGDGVSISDILFAERVDEAREGQVSKYGYAPVPLIGDYFPSSIGMLAFYVEVYGTDRTFGADSLYLLTYQLENRETGAVAGAYKRNIRARGRPVEPLIAQFDIANLPSGNYVLAIEVRDRRGELVARRDRGLYRNNPVRHEYDLQALDRMDLAGSFAETFTDRDSLAEHIQSLMPIADPLERKIIADRWKDRDMELMRRFFHSFWANRSTDPGKAWREYREQVVKVNRLFGCRALKGYETDRGRVYLKYGAPNSMMDRLHEMDALPYSLWHYYRAGKYTNRRFVFYQPDLASNCMELLHSEVPGEVQNPRWNQMIHSRNNAFQNVDPMPVDQMSGDRAREFFELPR